MWGLPWWLGSKESACNTGEAGSIPESGRSPGEGNGSPLHYSCLENSRDRGAWGLQSMGSQKESDVTERLNLQAPTHACIHSPLWRFIDTCITASSIGGRTGGTLCMKTIKEWPTPIDLKVTKSKGSKWLQTPSCDWCRGFMGIARFVSK